MGGAEDTPAERPASSEESALAAVEDEWSVWKVSCGEDWPLDSGVVCGWKTSVRVLGCREDRCGRVVRSRGEMEFVERDEDCEVMGDVVVTLSEDGWVAAEVAAAEVAAEVESSVACVEVAMVAVCEECDWSEASLSCGATVGEVTGWVG